MSAPDDDTRAADGDPVRHRRPDAAEASAAATGPVKNGGVSAMPELNGRLQREILPMRNTVRPTLITYDAKDPDTEFPPIEPLRPPAGAPNILLVLLDDVGFGASSAFGGPCQ